MKVQTEYESNIDYEKTYERIVKIFRAEQNTKGILTVYISGAVVNISPNGKVQISCSNVDEKKNVLALLQPHLVPISGKLWLKPYRAHFHTEWPPPPSFEFSACSPKYYCIRTEPDRSQITEELIAFEKRWGLQPWGSEISSKLDDVYSLLKKLENIRF